MPASTFPSAEHTRRAELMHAAERLRAGTFACYGLTCAPCRAHACRYLRLLWAHVRRTAPAATWRVQRCASTYLCILPLVITHRLNASCQPPPLPPHSRPPATPAASFTGADARRLATCFDCVVRAKLPPSTLRVPSKLHPSTVRVPSEYPSSSLRVPSEYPRSSLRVPSLRSMSTAF